MCGMLRRTECRIDRFGICDYLLIAARWELLCGVRRIEGDAQDDDDAREQLRRSLPILEYLRSVCGIEDRSKPDVSVRYVILASRDANRLDKQPLGSLDPRPFERSAIGALTSNRLSANGSPSAVRSSELA